MKIDKFEKKLLMTSIILLFSNLMLVNKIFKDFNYIQMFYPREINFSVENVSYILKDTSYVQEFILTFNNLGWEYYIGIVISFGCIASLIEIILNKYRK